MVVRFFLLIGVLLFFCGSAAAAAEPACLGCHPAHYAELGNCVFCHRGDPRTRRKAIAHRDLLPGAYAQYRLPDSPAVTAGNRLLDELACRRCHVIGRRGNRLAEELDLQVPRLSPQALQDALLQPALFMPDFHLTQAQLVVLGNALLAAAPPDAPEAGEIPLIVHFADAVAAADPFSKFCGACHRTLTSRRGGLGSGRIGFNLAGLLSPFYPPTFGGSRPWDKTRLKKWLANPRAVRSVARMPPVVLEEADFLRLLGLIEEPPGLAVGVDGEEAWAAAHPQR